MRSLDGRIALITGAGRGIGREHSLLFAAEGAKVVVNDPGVAPDGSGDDASVARMVAEEITSRGGQAVANTDSVTDWHGAERIVTAATEAFGDLHVVVNNAGSAASTTVLGTSEQQLDTDLAIHLKGSFAVTQHAARYWRRQAKAGINADRAVVNTSSGPALLGAPCGSAYALAKASAAAMTLTAARDLADYGVRVNCIAPLARTRLAGSGRNRQAGDTDGLSTFPLPEDAAAFDVFDPANVSPLVAYLATPDCPFNGQVFAVFGGSVGLYQRWSMTHEVRANQRWTVGDLAAAMDKLPREVPVTKDPGTITIEQYWASQPTA